VNTYEVKAGMVCVCSVKTVWSIPERFKGEFLTIVRYTNLLPLTFYLYLVIYIYMYAKLPVARC